MKKSAAFLLTFFILIGITLNIYASAEQVKKPELKKEFIKLKYIKARQVRELLQGYQSMYGRISIQNELNIVTIQDIPEIIEKMISLIKKIDVKPVDILFTVDLILGSMSLEEVPLNAKLRSERAPDKKLENDPLIREMKRIMNFKYLNRIGSSFLRIQDGKYSEQRIGGSGLEFRLLLTPRYVREEKEDTFQVNLDLRHDRVIREGVGTEKDIRLIETALTLKSGERTVVGVSKLDGGDKALILIISGKVIK